jgi:heavy metal sensor kinase
MAVVLALAGAFVYLRMSRELSMALRESLRARADDAAALIHRTPTRANRHRGFRLSDRAEEFVEVLTPGGAVVDSTQGAGGGRTVTRPELARAALGPTMLRGRHVAGIKHRALLFARPAVDAGGRRLVVVVGASTEDRDDALDHLTRALVIGGPIALLLSSLLGYVLAASALRPVEAMRRRADRISSADPGERLPLPVADDELRRLGRTLNAMLDRLQAALDRERVFVADASHELRTPLAILKTDLELALRAGRSEKELRDAIASATEETDRLAQLSEDLLVLARADHGQLAVKRDDVEVAEVLESTCRRFAPRAQAAGRRLVVEAPSELQASLDALLVGQALSNLVDNALRYGAGDIRLAAAGRNGEVELSVSDAGEGFPDDFVEHAFERFTRGEGGRSGGAGLGLSIVRAIARAHGGDASARGATVRVVLPS